jgi:hypothetical protein
MKKKPAPAPHRTGLSFAQTVTIASAAAPRAADNGLAE